MWSRPIFFLLPGLFRSASGSDRASSNSDKKIGVSFFFRELQIFRKTKKKHPLPESREVHLPVPMSTTMNKGLRSSWMLSSDNQPPEDDEEEQTDAQIRAFCAEKTLACIFARRHQNVLSVVIVLMMECGLQLAVAAPFLDPAEEYITTGESDACRFDMRRISPIMICAVGSVEKVLVAALQVFYSNGNKNGGGTDYSVSSHTEKDCCDVVISFKFNGADVKVKLLEYEGAREICIYIEE